MLKVTIVESPSTSSCENPRFIVVDVETGEILADANGFGYRTPQKAKAAFEYSMYYQGYVFVHPN
ncbi:hypothetical protein M2146_001113 [Lachnospiraceae bacterium PF1-22]